MLMSRYIVVAVATCSRPRHRLPGAPSEWRNHPQLTAGLLARARNVPTATSSAPLEFRIRLMF